MNKSTLLSFAVLALLLLNFGILAFLFRSNKFHGPKGRPEPREIVIEKLHFNEEQIAAYDKVIKNHRSTISALDDSIRTTKNELYQLLNSDAIENSKKEKLYLQLADYQMEIERTHFNHFLEIKSICTEDQLTDFENLTEELSKIFNNGRKGRND